MKRIIYTFVFSIICCQLIAQVNFNSLEATSTPAAAMLGYAPTNIDRPSTPQAISSSLQNAFNTTTSQFNPNINIEVTPFYAIPSKNNTLNTYIADSHLSRKGKSWGMQLLRNLALSMSTSQTDTTRFGTYKPGLGLAGGLRFCLVEYKPKTNNVLDSLVLKINGDWFGIDAQRFLMRVLNKDNACNGSPPLASVAQNVKAILNNNDNNYTSELKDLVSKKIDFLATKHITCADFIDSLTLYVTYIQTISDSSWVSNIKLADSLAQLPAGFRLDFNMAYLGVLPGNDFKTPAPGSIAFWLVPSYKIQQKMKSGKNLAIDLMLIGRLTINQKKNDSMYIDTTNYLDFGGKVAFSYNKFSISGEAIYRVASELDHPFTILDKKTWRITATASYKLTNYLSLQMTFGRNFDGKSATFDGAKAGSLMYLAGFNLGLASLSTNSTSNSKGTTQ
jgi:hypothetical protein